MTFHTFTIDELADESDNDYAFELTTSQSKLGIALKEDELQGIAEAMLATIDGDDSFDGKHVSELGADA